MIKEASQVFADLAAPLAEKLVSEGVPFDIACSIAAHEYGFDMLSYKASR